MAMLEVDPIKLSDPGASLKAYRKETEALNRLADKRQLGSDTYRSQDALRRLINEGALDKQRLSNVGAFNKEALARNIVTPGTDPIIASQLRRSRSLADTKTASEAMFDRTKGGFGAGPESYGGSVIDLARAPTTQTVPLDVEAALANALTLSTEDQTVVYDPITKSWVKRKVGRRLRGPADSTGTRAAPTAQHLPGRNLTPETIRKYDDHVASAAKLMPGIITGNEKIIEIGQDERGEFFLIEVQGKDGRPRKFKIRPKGQTR
jgi:hypothetical protein